MRYGNSPVLVVLTGEDMSNDWARNRITGLDLAKEGIVVVTVQYRSNIFGWLTINDSTDMVGNFGLQDQSMALEWIKENAKLFGGNPKQVTLLGHGTSGAPCALLQYLLNNNLRPTQTIPFNQLILMSIGNIERSFQSVTLTQDASKVIVKKLGCQFEEDNKQLLSCLRSKSISDILKAFESVFDHGNGTLHLGPSIDQSVSKFLFNSTLMNDFPTTIIGITSNEAAFLHDFWLELARDSYTSLKSYINTTILEKVICTQGNIEDKSCKRNLDALNWRYFNDDFEENPIYLLAAMLRFLSEYNYELPFYRLLNQLSNVMEKVNPNINKLYAYIYDFSKSMDIRGKINLFGGSSHSADLPLLFGPTLYLQIARRRFNVEEENVYRKMRTPIINFIKTGIPTPGRDYDSWRPYTSRNRIIYDLGEKWLLTDQYSFLKNKKNLQQISQLLLRDQSILTSHARRNELRNSYQVPKSNSEKYLSDDLHNSPYTIHLMRMYRFWEIFLPQTFSNDYIKNTDDTAITQHLLFLEASADAARFKHGFFIMLGLIIILLALLCVCVYLLRRNALVPSSHLNCDL